MHKVHINSNCLKNSAPYAIKDLYASGYEKSCKTCKNPYHLTIPELDFYSQIEEKFFRKSSISKLKHGFENILESKSPSLNYKPILEKYDFDLKIIFPTKGKEYEKFIKTNLKKFVKIIKEWSNEMSRVDLSYLLNFQNSKGFSNYELGKEIIRKQFSSEEYVFKLLEVVKYFMKISSFLNFKNFLKKDVNLYFHYLRSLRCYMVSEGYSVKNFKSQTNKAYNVYLSKNLGKNWDSLYFLFLNLEREKKFTEMYIEEKMIDACFLEILSCYDDNILSFRLDQILEVFYCFEMKKNLYLKNEKKKVDFMKKQYHFILRMFTIKILIDRKILQDSNFMEKLNKTEDLKNRIILIKEKLNLKIFRLENFTVLEEDTDLDTETLREIYDTILKPIKKFMEERSDKFKEDYLENNPMFDSLMTLPFNPVKEDQDYPQTTRDFKDMRDKLNQEHAKLQQAYRLLEELKLKHPPLPNQTKKYSCCDAVIQDLGLELEFNFIDIPKNFDDLYHQYVNYRCSWCGKRPKSSDFMLCLLCGEISCLKNCGKIHKSKFLKIFLIFFR